MQPKIPDGKISESLGFQTQAVGEFTCLNADTPVTGDGIMHLLLMPGQNCALVAQGDLKGQYPFLNPALTAFTAPDTKLRCVGFEGSNNIQFNGTNGTGGNITFEDNYAYMRYVSCGLRLSLLNPQEEDDGWWEAVRIKEPINTEKWGILCVDNQQNTLKGTVAPQDLLTEYSATNFVNENSYTTGLLRDLHLRTFTLQGVKDEHDFEQQMTVLDLDAEDIVSETQGAAGVSRRFGNGRTDVERLINQWVDNSFDMVYIRIHGRATGNSSRLHYNVVANQEIVFPATAKESRFHTANNAVGNIGDHISARNSNVSAAHVVPM